MRIDVRCGGRAGRWVGWVVGYSTRVLCRYYDTWMATAVANTAYYEKTYPCIAHLTGLTRPPITASARNLATTPSRSTRTSYLPFMRHKAESHTAAAAPATSSGAGGADGPVLAPERPRGMLVCFSFAFREGENLKPDAFSPEGLTPGRVFE